METEEELYECIRKDYETDFEFNFRKGIYDNVFNKTNSKKKALIYSNIWVNIMKYECEYPEETMKEIEEYKPNDTLYSKDSKVLK